MIDGDRVGNWGYLEEVAIWGAALLFIYILIDCPRHLGENILTYKSTLRTL